MFEDFDYRMNRGFISSTPTSDGRSTGESTPVLELPVHMSYPFLIAREDVVYCIPETFQANKISMFASRNFPNGWEAPITLIEGVPGVDSTVVWFNDRYWLFATQEKPEDPDLKLFIWHAAALGGPWMAHAANPVKTDYSSARPGGTPFVHEGVLYRPSQDSSRTYGGRISMNAIRRLTPTEFSEECVSYIEPCARSPYPDGLHTLSAFGEMTLIDGKRYTFEAQKMFRTLREYRTKASHMLWTNSKKQRSRQ